MSDLKAVLAHVAAGQSLSRKASCGLFSSMVSGEASSAQIGALLMGLRMRGETLDEIVGAAEAMRARMLTVRAPAGAVDIVGTGGDGIGTYNISTAAAFIVAGAGTVVAKHGNRAVSSKSGAADVLTALGVPLEQTPQVIERCLASAKIGFMFAPAHHPALKSVMPARLELGLRTIFNILGPLLNPAGVTRHLIGVYSRDLLAPMAHALSELGSVRALVVHGSDGLDEITTTGATHMAMLANGKVHMFDLNPEDVGLIRTPLDALKGGCAASNGAALRAMLGGKAGPYRDIALLNAAGALLAAGVTEDWNESMAMARASVDEGRGMHALELMVAATHDSQPMAPVINRWS